MYGEAERKSDYGRLFHYLEFSGLNDLSVFIPQLINIHAPVEVLQRHPNAGWCVFYIQNLSSHKIVNL